MFRNPLKSNLYTELSEFFGADPCTLSVDSRRFPQVQLPNIQAAIDRICAESGAPRRVVSFSAVDLLSNSFANLLIQKAPLGPVSYTNVPTGPDRYLRCVVSGIHLVDLHHARIAVYVRSEEHAPEYYVEIMAGTDSDGAAFMQRLWDEARTHSVYRHQVLCIEGDDYSRIDADAYNISFRVLPEVHRDDIVLPDAVMEIIERNTVGFFKHAALLRASGRSVKRGLLMHGPPGTGKTYTARWLAQSIDGITVVLVSGNQLWMIRQVCHLARMLAPSLVILEDVDLIAGQRDEARHPFYTITLHELLNEMDGIDSDGEVVFLLTTNKPEVIEPAIASRPGRVDQAIEFPLPDSTCRRRLFDLYSRGLHVELDRIEEFISRTEGASPAFIQELLRKAALFAAEANDTVDGRLNVTDAHCEAALRELLFGGGDLTRDLLGFKSAQMTFM